MADSSSRPMLEIVIYGRSIIAIAIHGDPIITISIYGIHMLVAIYGSPIIAMLALSSPNAVALITANNRYGRFNLGG